MNNNLRKTQNKEGHSIVNRKGSYVLIAVMFAFIIINSLLSYVKAEPAGMTISSNVTESKQTTSPDNRSDEGGTITTLGVNVLQQNQFWKAYVGNITGKFILEDASGFSIYEWPIQSADLTGEVYASREMQPNWTAIECSNDTVLASEDTFMGFNSTSVYSINRTFNESEHPKLEIGSVTISADQCRSTSTYVNDTAQAQASASFPVVLLAADTNVIYASPINQGSDSFHNGTKVDFQLMIPDKDQDTTTYYFFAEIAQ